MNDPFIPMNAYIFIGVASLVLAFVTVMDNQPIESNESGVNENEKSFTEYLPTFNGSNENISSETVNEVAKEPTDETSNAQPQNDMFNSNLNSDQGLLQNEYQSPQPQPPQPNDMFNSNLNSDQGLAQNEYQSQPQSPPPQNDMFNSNLNSDQGLAQNEAPLLPQPQQAPLQQKQYGNPFTGGKNKTGKNNATKNGKSKRNKKTKRYNSK